MDRRRSAPHRATASIRRRFAGRKPSRRKERERVASAWRTEALLYPIGGSKEIRPPDLACSSVMRNAVLCPNCVHANTPQLPSRRYSESRNPTAAPPSQLVFSERNTVG